MSETLDAPVVAVTVFPDAARVTRRGRATLAAGEHVLAVEGLPLGLEPDSVRVAGSGPGRVLGVDVLRRVRPRTDDSRVTALRARREEIAATIAALDDANTVELSRHAFLEVFAQRAGSGLGRAVAGGADPGHVVEVGDALAEQFAGIAERRRTHLAARERAREDLAAVEREIGERTGSRLPDGRAVLITLDVSTDGEIELDVTYQVPSAGWTPLYDARLSGERVTLTWLGLVSQRTGEDWPACELRLSTARPSAATAVPELDPWYVDVFRPPLPQPRTVSRMATGYGAAPEAAMLAAAPAGGPPAPAAAPAPRLRDVTAEVEQGVTAATYRVARPVAVPADGTEHRATITVVDLDARLDHVTAPKVAPEAHLRAVVTNTSPHTLLPGRVAVFHDADFVGTTGLATVAPGEEIELQLGVDDRIRVERELVRRSTGRTVLGSTRRVEAAYRITVANHSGAPSRLTVLDQFPVSRHESVVVRDAQVDPPGAERSDLGEVTWRLELADGESRELTLSFRLEHPRGVELTGWRD